jgi:hypothetical protein
MALVGPDGVTPAAAQVKPEEPPAGSQPPPVVEAATAFIVVQLPNGRWVVTDDLDTVVIAERKPSQDDLIGGAANVQAEIISRKTADMAAATTIQTQMAMARQIAQQQTNETEEAAIAAIQRQQVPPAFRGRRG